MMPQYEVYRNKVEEALQQFYPLLGSGTSFDMPQILTSAMEDRPPQPLRAAMRYSLLLGGKRVRPVLLLMSYQLLRDDYEMVLPFACAMEMIHTYSLIHDDLPALDNDCMRRNQPSNHVVFGENMAILAGDGLLNLAYETMLNCSFTLSHPKQALRAIREIAGKAGVRGMIAGQTLDVVLEGQDSSEEAVRYIHQHKTADLLTAPVTAGLMLAQANEEYLKAGEKYGRCLGLCFQIVDDLLDVHGEEQKMGKTLHKDALCGKQTWPSVFGIEASQIEAVRLAQEAAHAISIFGEKAEPLQKLALQLVTRDN